MGVLARLNPRRRRLDVPSGRTAALDYRDDGSVAASVKLQELFGLAETPRVGPRGEPVLLLLLAPNGRPVQTTRDLRSFWERTYPEVRKELRGRYPRHPWPDDPWTATPTARTKRQAVHRPELRFRLHSRAPKQNNDLAPRMTMRPCENAGVA